MKNLIYLLFTATLFLATACDKEDDMTSDSSNNHDILRCKINGENWTPAGGDLFITKPYDLQYYNDEKFLVLSASNSIDEFPLNGGLSIFVKNINLGEHLLHKDDNSFSSHNNSNSDECKYYDVIDSSFYSFINISELDTVNFIMKGTFESSIINECNDTLRYSDGYFDLHYRF